MIDINLLRNDIDAVAIRLAARGYVLDVAGFSALESRRKEIQSRTEQLQAQSNALAKQVGQAKAKKDDTGALLLMTDGSRIGKELDSLESENKETQSRLREFVSLIPNLLHESVRLVVRVAVFLAVAQVLHQARRRVADVQRDRPRAVPFHERAGRIIGVVDRVRLGDRKSVV